MSYSEYKEKDMYDLPLSCERNTVVSTNESELMLVPSDVHNHIWGRATLPTARCIFLHCMHLPALY